MAEGSLCAPAQFGGLIPRSLDDYSTPWECVEVPKFETPSDIGTPSPASWQIAMVDWSALNERESVWHYCNRANPVPFGCRMWEFHQEIPTGLGTYLHYKPRHGVYEHQPPDNLVDLVFRRVPPPLMLTFELSLDTDMATVKVYTAMSGNLLQEIQYDRDFRITWKRFQEDLRIHMLQKSQISCARDFRFVFSEGEAIAPNRLLFRPLRTMAHMQAQERLQEDKKKAAQEDKKKAVQKGMKKPAGKQGMKKPAGKQGMKKPAGKQGMKKPAGKQGIMKGMKKPA